MKTRTFTLAPLCALLLCAAAAWAAGPNATRITVERMHCAGCARKIGAKLYEKPGVVLVEYDVKGKFVLVTPQANKQLSPRMLWECIQQTQGCPEQGGYQPVLLEGPHGRFTQKPNI